MKKTWAVTFVVVLVVILGLVLVVIKLGEPGKGKEGKNVAKEYRAPDIKARLARFAPVGMAVDPSLLTAEDKAVLAELVLAARGIDDIYWKQSAPEGLELERRLAASADPADRDFLRYVDINFGPYDRLDENRPFIGSWAKPAGAAFYPKDMTREEFEGAVKAYPGLKDDFESPYTVLRRKEGGLEAVPYSEAYRSDLEAVAGHLRKAAALTTNASLKAYLSRKADDLLSNDYYKGDCLWIDCKGNKVELVIGPYEVYEDALLGLKAAYECYVYVNDEADMARIKGYLDFLSEMQTRLPVDKRYKDQPTAGLASPLHVVYEVFAAGDARAGVQTSAFVLPNDEKVRESKGSKKVFLKNVMEAKFSRNLVPIAGRVLRPEDAAAVSSFAYFTETILHEISHALGVNYSTLPDGSRVPVNKALKEMQAPIEEAKADVTGIFQVPFLIQKSWIPADKEKEIYATYLAGMFRAIRFGANEAHGRATLIQLNYLTEQGAFFRDAATGHYGVNPGRIKPAVEKLTHDLLVLEGDGDYGRAAAFVAKYTVLGEDVKKALAGLADIPVDIAPVFRTDF